MSRCGPALGVLCLWLSLSGFDWPGARARQAERAARLGAEGRAAAMRQLSLGPRPEVVPLLRQGLEDRDPGVRREAARSLGVLRVGDAGQALVEHLEDPAPEVRSASARALGRLAHPSAATALARSLGDADAAVRLAGLAALAELEAKAALPEVIALLDDPDTLVRVEAARTLALLGDASSVAALSHKAADPVPQVRAQVLRTLAVLDGASGMHLFVRALQDPSEDVVIAALYGLGAVGSEDAVVVVARYASDPRARVARAAYAALSRNPTRESLELLVEHAIDARFADLAPAALAQAVERDPHLVEPLGDALAARLGFSTAPEASTGWVSLARELGLAPRSASLRAALLRALEHRRVSAAAVLTALQGSTDPDTCARILAMPPTPEALEAAAPCVRAGQGLWVGPLGAWLEVASAQPQILAVLELLGMARSPRAARTLQPWLSAQHAAVRALALDAVARAGEPSLADEVLQRLRDDPDPRVRAAAAATYGTLAPPEALDRLLDLPEERRRGEAFWHAAALALGAGRAPSAQRAKDFEHLLRQTVVRGADDAAALHALDAAALWQTEQALGIVLEVGDGHSVARREAAAFSLARFDDGRARERLYAWLESPEQGTIAAASLVALADSSTRVPRTLLRRLLREGPWPVGPAAAFALARQAQPGDEALFCELAEAREPHVAANGLAALATLGRPECAAEVTAWARELDDVRGRSARLALGEQAAGTSATPALPSAPWLAVQLRDGRVAPVTPASLCRLRAAQASIWAVESAYGARFASPPR